MRYRFCSSCTEAIEKARIDESDVKAIANTCCEEKTHEKDKIGDTKNDQADSE